MRRGVLDIVADGTLGAFDVLAHAAVGQPDALVGFVNQRKILAQRRHGGDHFEGRTRRVQPEARAVEVVFGSLRGFAGFRLHRPRNAHRRQQVAGGRVHHHRRALILGRRLQLILQNCRHLHLQPRVDRHAHVALAIEHLADLGILRIVEMAQQRHQLAIVVTNHARHLAIGLFHVDQRGPVVIAAQAARFVALHEGGVAGAPSQARAQVAEQIEHQAAEGIVAAVAARAGAVDVDAESLVIGAAPGEFVPVAGGERQPVAIVDGAHGYLAHHFLETRIVLIPPRAIGLQHQGSLSHGRRAVHHLHVPRLGQHDGAGDGENGAHRHRHAAERRGGVVLPAAMRDRLQDSQHREIRQHGRAAVAEERRHHAGERHHSERPAGNQQEFERGGRRQPGP